MGIGKRNKRHLSWISKSWHNCGALETTQQLMILILPHWQWIDASRNHLFFDVPARFAFQATSCPGRLGLDPKPLPIPSAWREPPLGHPLPGELKSGKTYRKMSPKPHYLIVLNFEITSKTFRKGFDATISCFIAWNHCHICHVNVRYPIFKVQGFKRESHGIGRQIPLVCPVQLHLAIYTTQHDKGRWRLASGQLVT